VKSLASKAWNEVSNPDSDLRSKIAPVVGTIAEMIPDPRAQALAKAAKQVSKGEYGALANSAREAYNARQKVEGIRKGSKQLKELAEGLKQPKPTKFMSDAKLPPPPPPPPKKTYNWTNPTGKPKTKKQQQLQLEDATPLTKAEMRLQRVKKLAGLPTDYDVPQGDTDDFSGYYPSDGSGRGGAWEEYLSPEELEARGLAMRVPDDVRRRARSGGMPGRFGKRGAGFFGDFAKGLFGTIKKASPILGMLPFPGAKAVAMGAQLIPDSWVGDGRPVGAGTPDYATLMALQKGAQKGGAKRSNKRGQMVAKIMRERGVSLPEASRIVKAEGLA
jgi:hypothetical protein